LNYNVRVDQNGGKDVSLEKIGGDGSVVLVDCAGGVWIRAGFGAGTGSNDDDNGNRERKYSGNGDGNAYADSNVGAGNCHPYLGSTFSNSNACSCNRHQDSGPAFSDTCSRNCNSDPGFAHCYRDQNACAIGNGNQAGGYSNRYQIGYCDGLTNGKGHSDEYTDEDCNGAAHRDTQGARVRVEPACGSGDFPFDWISSAKFGRRDNGKYYSTILQHLRYPRLDTQ